MINLKKITTENRNHKTMNLDLMSSYQIASAMNLEDMNVIHAVKKELKNIAKLIDLTSNAIAHGGRVFYLGAGTSGRLAVCDASEILPTFGVDKTFIGLMAGGDKAFIHPIEGAEDSLVNASVDLKKHHLNKKDIVIGLAASGRTPYVIGGLTYAKKMKCKTGSIACTSNAEISKYADVAIEAVSGPEVLTGSTRLKAGTTQKLILNMISTGAMIRLGKCYQNLMVDVVPTNKKLIVRAENIVMMATSVDRATAIKALKKCNYQAKVAIVMILYKCNEIKARALIKKAHGHIRNIKKEK